MGLTEKRDNGSWKLKGVDWKQIAPGAVITKKTWEKLYGALWKLKDYEETGLSPDQVSELQGETQEQARAMLERVAKLSDEIERMKGEERQQWITVTDRLPDPESYILVSFENCNLSDIATYRVDDAVSRLHVVIAYCYGNSSNSANLRFGADVWNAIGKKPLFGHRSEKASKTFWGCYMKGVN